jgi:hypothetical protein
MSNWKTNRAEAAMREGTDKIMKAAQQASRETKREVEVPKPRAIEFCVGVGMNQFFPEYVTITPPEEDVL